VRNRKDDRTPFSTGEVEEPSGAQHKTRRAPGRKDRTGMAGRSGRDRKQGGVFGRALMWGVCCSWIGNDVLLRIVFLRTRFPNKIN
jgi:hypothetical protein